jgi:hypothetical protein
VVYTLELEERKGKEKKLRVKIRVFQFLAIFSKIKRARYLQFFLFRRSILARGIQQCKIHREMLLNKGAMAV